MTYEEINKVECAGMRIALRYYFGYKNYYETFENFQLAYPNMSGDCYLNMVQTARGIVREWLLKGGRATI